MEETPGRISKEARRIIQLIEEDNIESWFSFLEYFVIMIYGLGKDPYCLPKFITPIFSYELLRHRLTVNDFYFVSKNKKALFNFSYVVFSLIARHKKTIDMIETEMLSFGLVHYVCWKYDPHSVISSLGKQDDLSTYVYEPKLEIEQVANVLPLP